MGLGAGWRSKLEVLLGRRDGTMANLESANNTDPLDVLREKFRKVNPNDTDLVAPPR